VTQKKSFKLPKFKGLNSGKKPAAKSPPSARKILRGPLFWIIAALIAVSVFGQISATGEEYKKVETSAILNEISLNNVKSALVIDRDQKVQVILKDGEFVEGSAKIEASYVAGQEALIVELLTSNPPSAGWDIKVPKQSLFVSLLFSILPILLIIFLLLLFMGGGQGGRVLSFGRSRAKLQNKEMPTNTFVDVAGADEAVAELREIKDFLASPDKYKAIGAKIPKGVLLYGPPGTGKTLLARAVAGEAKVPFYSISGSEFVEMFVGVGASRVRDLFAQAKQNAPAIVFVDEIDAVGRQRGAGLGGGNDEREQTLNQLLVEMDGFEANGQVILIAATNRPDVLDPALLRPGRFDRQISVDRPDLKGRAAILAVHAKNKPVAKDVDLESYAKRTPGFTGVAHALPHTDPVHKVTIMPRGRALGYTMVLPDEDRYAVTRNQMLDQLAYTMGGRAAEELIFHDPTTGASNDIEKATNLARAMVTQYGMTQRLGAIKLGISDSQPFLGRDYGHQRDYSESIAAVVDSEIRELIENAHQEAFDILVANRETLDRLVEELLENETLNKEEIAAVFKKVRKVKPRAAWTGSQKRIPSNQPPVALKPAKIKVIEEEKPAKKTAAKKVRKESIKDVNE